MRKILTLLSILLVTCGLCLVTNAAFAAQTETVYVKDDTKAEYDAGAHSQTQAVKVDAVYDGYVGLGASASGGAYKIGSYAPGGLYLWQ